MSCMKPVLGTKQELLTFEVKHVWTYEGLPWVQYYI